MALKPLELQLPVTAAIDASFPCPPPPLQLLLLLLAQLQLLSGLELTAQSVSSGATGVGGEEKGREGARAAEGMSTTAASLAWLAC